MLHGKKLTFTLFAELTLASLLVGTFMALAVHLVLWMAGDPRAFYFLKG
jgi:hypothetical protein